MDSPARKQLQIPFKEVRIGQRFHMVNSVMKAAIPGAAIFTKVHEECATDNTDTAYVIRPDWPVEIINVQENEDLSGVQKQT